MQPCPVRVCLGSTCTLETTLIQEMSLLKSFIPAHQLQISNTSSTPSSQRMELFVFLLPPLLLAWKGIVKVFTESYTMVGQKMLKRMFKKLGQSHAYILYHGILLNHVEGDIKCVLKTDDCRRKILFQHFDTVLEQFDKLHLCCDKCATTCECGETYCAKYAEFPMKRNPQTVLHTAKGRKVAAGQTKAVEGNFIKYHKSLVMKLVNTAANGNCKTLTNLQFM